MSRCVDIELVMKNIQQLRGCTCSYSDGIVDDVETMMDMAPTADVVEREKIDKAIEEMERYSTFFEYANRSDLASAVDCCIGMIQKNIGESKWQNIDQNIG